MAQKYFNESSTIISGFKQEQLLRVAKQTLDYQHKRRRKDDYLKIESPLTDLVITL